MEKEKVCSSDGCGCGKGCCGGAHGCSYGSYGMHSILRLFAVLLVMILIFHLGMQVGELRTQYSNCGYHEMRFEKGMNYGDMPMLQFEKQMTVPAPEVKE